MPGCLLSGMPADQKRGWRWLRRSYIDLELQLGEIERVRTLYQKYLQWAPARCGAWCKYAEVEAGLGELGRARAIFELAIEQPLLDMPEILWKARRSPCPHACAAFCLSINKILLLFWTCQTCIVGLWQPCSPHGCMQCCTYIPEANCCCCSLVIPETAGEQSLGISTCCDVRAACISVLRKWARLRQPERVLTLLARMCRAT